MPVGLVVSAVLLLESKPVIVFADSSPECEIWVSKKNGTGYKSSYKSVLGGSPEEHSPVKIVMFPVLLEVNTLFHDSLFLGSVEAAPIADCELEPRGGWVSVTQTALIVSPVLVGELLGLWPVSQLIPAEVS